MRFFITVKLKNNIDKTSESKGKGNAYLTSKHDGNMRSMIYFFAPAGGKITDFKDNSSIVKGKSATYENLKLYYCPLFELKPRKSVTFTFKVTTAAGVNVQPKVVHTPLLTSYRNAKEPK